jgi:branched-chain amino acid transport system permease protein
VTVVQGVIFIVCVPTFRRGIVGEVVALWNRRRADEPTAPA